MSADGTFGRGVSLGPQPGNIESPNTAATRIDCRNFITRIYRRRFRMLPESIYRTAQRLREDPPPASGLTERPIGRQLVLPCTIQRSVLQAPLDGPSRPTDA